MLRTGVCCYTTKPMLEAVQVPTKLRQAEKEELQFVASLN